MRAKQPLGKWAGTDPGALWAMIEHLIFLVVEALVKNQQAERQAELRTRVPELDRLREQASETLSQQTITIPAARNTPMAIVVGVVLGTVLFGLCLLGFVVAINLVADPKKLTPEADVVIIVGFLLLLVVLLGGSIWKMQRMLRGGELLLHRTGVEFRYRDRAVSCPWSLFRTSGAVSGNNVKAVVPIAPRAVDRVELLWRDSVVAYGREVRLKPFRFVSDTEVELRNVYAANLREVVRLLQDLGRRLG